MTDKPERRKVDRRVSPSVTDFAMQECVRLRARVAKLEAALQKILSDNGLNSDNAARAIVALSDTISLAEQAEAQRAIVGKAMEGKS